MHQIDCLLCGQDVSTALVSLLKIGETRILPEESRICPRHTYDELRLVGLFSGSESSAGDIDWLSDIKRISSLSSHQQIEKILTTPTADCLLRLGSGASLLLFGFRLIPCVGVLYLPRGSWCQRNSVTGFVDICNPMIHTVAAGPPTLASLTEKYISAIEPRDGSVVLHVDGIRAKGKPSLVSLNAAISPYRSSEYAIDWIVSRS